MAFNFNWSPLTADADFYERARDLLTTALNKSPKPPIIVGDILVTELNLGSVPPELEILEIGDLAEDRFRGIFKMCYKGDAYLTLKTRVQANPLNTYLHSKPSFTSPQPLAASSGLTIPLSLTLSDIKLSAFIILVFSKQKGLTLVFRNDPLESLKVSSTFDSIQFVRDYLQRTIEGKLRDLIMDELPAIIHRLSLRLWCPDQLPKEEMEADVEDDDATVDPFASPPQDAVDANGNVMDEDFSSLSLDGGSEAQPLWSNKNLLRLAALGDCHRTLSLFTPGIKDVVFRAAVGSQERAELSANLSSTSLTSTHQLDNASTTYSFSDTATIDRGHLPSRPSLVSLGSATAGLSLGAGRSKSHIGRKQKKRVVNLRRSKTGSAPASEAGDSTNYAESTNDTDSIYAPFSEPLAESVIAEEPEETAPSSVTSPSRSRFNDGGYPVRPSFQPSHVVQQLPHHRVVDTIRKAEVTKAQEKAREAGQMSSLNAAVAAPQEQDWVLKMAGEIARRVVDEKQRHGVDVWRAREEAPPPAYVPRQ